MKEERLVRLLEGVLGNSSSARGGEEAVFHCPKCNHHKKKLTVNKSTQKFQCWVCNFKGSRVKSILKAAKVPQKYFNTLQEIDSQYNFNDTAKIPDVQKELTLPEGFIPLLEGKGLIRDKALKYLQSRGLSLYEIIKYNIGYAETGELSEMIIIPSYSEDGILNYWVARSFNPNAYFKHKLAPSSKDVIGLEIFINFDIPIIICEGMFDAISIRRNAIPLFGKKISKKLYSKLIKGNVKQIYLILDNDAIRESIGYAKELMAYDKEIFLIELEGKDPNDIGFNNITQLLHKAKPLTATSLLEKNILFQ